MLQIIKASAGSGKTYTLALEYITLLLGEKMSDGTYRLSDEEKRDYHRHILAVTFTNKATEEMKERIIKELAVLAGRWDGSRSPYMDTLCKRFGVDDEQKISHAADIALGELLFDFTNFNVSTIDSFFQIILRTFALEIDAPYDYNIELDDKYAMQVGIRDFLSSLRNYSRLTDSHVVGWLNKYVNEKISDGSNWNIFSATAPAQGSSDLFGFATVINTEQYRKAGEAMSRYFAENDGGNVGLLQVAVNRFVEKAVDMIKRDAGKVLSVIGGKGLDEYIAAKGTAAMVRRFADGEINRKSNTDIDKVLKYLDTPDKMLKVVKKNPELRQSAIDEITPMFESMKAIYTDLLLFDHINSHIYMLGLLGGISRGVSQYRKDNNLILLSDTNELLNRVIREENDAPFIYERIGVRINNFLVDEFQDTSALQWRNFKPLLGNSLAEGHDNLIIGDEKQCIYRFRNSDPSLLQSKVAEEFGGQSRVSGDKSTNWRSAPHIVKFNNTFFTLMALCMDVVDVYANVVQMPNTKPRNVNGYVRVEIIPQETEVEGGEPLAFADAVLERLPAELRAIMARGYKQSDIAILVNRNTEGAMVIKRLLEYNLANPTEQAFKVISSDSLLLKNSPTVRLIISHLRYLSVAVELREGQRTERQELEEKIHRLLRQYENFLNKGFTPEQAMEQAVTSPVSQEEMLGEVDEFVPRDAQCHNLVSVVERIIEKAVSPEARERENPFISALQDYVIDFSMRANPSIRSFVDWWDRCCDKLSITSPAGVDAINVMTIHKSKGLEFPCVIIPFANWEMCKMEGTIWFSKDEVLATKLFTGNDADVLPPLVPVKHYSQLVNSKLSKAYVERVREGVVDSLNKTYVAFTRAVDELHIFTEKAAASDPDIINLTINEYLCRYAGECDSNVVAGLNEKYGASVAVGVEVTDSGFHVGDAAINDRPVVEPEPVGEMVPYFVVNRHNLARFDLPDVFYTVQQERGVLLHKILGMIHNEGELERCLKYCRVRCVVLPEQYDEVSNLVRNMLTQCDEVKQWFARGNRVYKERTISVGGKRYRPDRVVVLPEGRTVVIDFKFGDKHLAQYRQQVKRYMEFVAEAGLLQVSGRIWYPLEGVIEVVD